MEKSLLNREKELRLLEEKNRQQDEALANLNRLLEQQERSFNTLTSIGRLFTRGRSVREVLGSFLGLVIKAVRCEAGVIALRDRAGLHFSVAAAIGERQDLVRSQIFSEGEGVMGEVVRKGEPYLVPDASKEKRIKADIPEAIQKELRNAMCIPIKGVSQILGAIFLVNTRERKRFNKQDMELTEVLSLRLAQELDWENEFAQSQEEGARFSMLLRVGELLHGIQDQPKVLELLLQMAMRLVKAQGAALFFADETQQNLSCSASSEKMERLLSIPSGMGIVGWVALEGQPVAAMTEGDSRFAAEIESPFPYKVDSIVAVPIRGSRRILGVLEAVNKSRARAGFDQADINLLMILGREAGVALDYLDQAQQNSRTILELTLGLARFVDARAPYLMGHSERVAQVSRILGEEMGLSPDELQQLYMSALLHDLGNVGIDDELFLTPGKFTAEEMGRMKQHTSIGAAILKDVKALRHLMGGPLWHHERYDGTGYPQGLKGDQIPIFARIIGVAEAYDAIRSPRPYREALGTPEALDHIRSNDGTFFDPKVVSVLFSSYQRGKLKV